MDIKLNWKDFVAVVRKQKSGADEVRAKLAQIDIDAMETRASELEAKRRALLGSGEDSDIDAIEAEIVKANRDIERAIAIQEELRERLATIEAEQTRAASMKAYDEARARSAKLLSEIPKRWDSAANEVVDIIRDMLLGEQAISHVNANLPEGVAPLPSIELTMRGMPGEPEQRGKSNLRKPAWYYTKEAEGWGPVEEQFVAQITPNPDGKTGKLARSGGGYSRNLDVELRQYREVEILVERGWARPVPLAASVKLPAFRVGEADVWAPFNSGFSGEFGANASVILDHIERMNQQRLRPPADPRPDRSTRTVLERVDV
ncbi:hypothetical protein [Mesorhizobium sp. LNHC229A00]|uniref:hypothetical protein n=1 Tax=Mesorhizobium sp. LNHC229A00 TaxID=1287240 RepID=UPI0003CE1882|nr:hypothetical protein [Mesorhizobium sp. LNHC229A00]ESY92317.1 hypothetical protein X741_21675 [Mesorhizobium sp. LNHC229A00]